MVYVKYGVKISQSGYYAFKRRDKSRRAIEDERLSVRISEIYETNYRCYGLRKIWRTLRNDGKDVARCTVERLMKRLGIRGAVRGKTVRTTIPAPSASVSRDLVKRDFSASAPNRLWVADFTYVSTRSGWCYTAFVIDVFSRRIAGWRVSTSMDAAMVRCAFEMAAHARDSKKIHDTPGTIHHNDRGSQYTSEDFVELLERRGVSASVGEAGSSYDNALAESIIGIYKTELVKRFGPWKNYEQLNLRTAEWVLWYNTKRISERNGYLTPLRVEDIWYSSGLD
jgi:putative transposase